MTKTILVDELTFNHMKLSYVGDFGHDFRNKERILDKIDFVDSSFITTSPDALDFLPKNKKSFFIPNPSDPSFEVLNNFNKNCNMDVFFALSHGVHRGILKSGKFDERARFIEKLMEITKNIKYISG